MSYAMNEEFDSWERSDKKDSFKDDNKAGFACAGIDFGTTNSCVSVWIASERRSKTLKDPQTGLRTVKSVAWVDEKGEISAVGDAAIKLWQKQLLAKNSGVESSVDGVLIASVKRFLGRRYSELSPEQLSMVSCDVFCDGEDRILLGRRKQTSSYDDESKEVEIGVRPETVAVAIIKYLIRIAEGFFKCPVNQIVMTVPALYNFNRRQAIREAGEKAGAKVLCVLSEPMAAAMAYGLFVAGKKKMAILDIGGATTDVAILEVDDGRLKAMALGGCSSLGGNDVDNLLMKWVLGKFEGNKINISDAARKQELLNECEAAKIKLCDKTSRESNSEKQTVWVTDNTPITSDEFEAIVFPMKEQLRGIIRASLQDACLDPESVNEVVLVGMSTIMPWVRTVALEEFRATELCTNVKADRVVSQGAAIKGAIATGIDRYQLSKILVLDAAPFSIGVETGSGSFSVIIERNSNIPCTATKEFITHFDHQRAITLDIYEGEEPIAKDNNWIDCVNFPVKEGSKRKAGEITLRVTFSIDADTNLLVDVVSADHNLDNQNDDEKNWQFYFLCGFLVALIVAYCFAKINVKPLVIEP